MQMLKCSLADQARKSEKIIIMLSSIKAEVYHCVVTLVYYDGKEPTDLLCSHSK